MKRPFTTPKFTLLAGVSRSTPVSLVIRVLDDLTEDVITAGVKVLIKGKKESVPILNHSGYFCFTKIKPGTYTVEVKPDIYAADTYFGQEGVVELPENPSEEWRLNPVKEFRLNPKPSFPFPAFATLIRGTVREEPAPEEIGPPVVGAEVQAGYLGAESIIKTKTDHNGEFVLFVKKKNIELEADKPTLKNIRIDIEKDNKAMAPLYVNDQLTQRNEPLLKEGKTASLGVIEFEPY